jgi:LysM repeat protein
MRISKILAILLVAALVVTGLTACERRVEEREGESGEVVSTPGAETPSVGEEEETPAPGETVVSAVTPITEVPSSGATATQMPAGETAQVTEPVATSEPVATEEPPTTEPSQPSGSDGGSASFIWHTVQRGETLSAIARRYGTTTQAIARANSLANANQIYAGQKLKIPTTSGGSSGGSTGASGCRITHTVKQGEWVWQIARNYGVDPTRILAANGLTVQSANTIYPGTVLCIP